MVCIDNINSHSLVNVSLGDYFNLYIRVRLPYGIPIFSVFMRPVAPLGIKLGEKDTRAGVAQLVERNLAKVEVTGSNPVTRSKLEI